MDPVKCSSMCSWPKRSVLHSVPCRPPLDPWIHLASLPILPVIRIIHHFTNSDFSAIQYNTNPIPQVHLVWASGLPIRRFQSRIWILCAFVLLGYVVIFILMLVARIGYLQPPDADGRQTCIIGLEPMASIPLLSYDVFLNIFLTSLFAYPLLGGSSPCGIGLWSGGNSSSQGAGAGAAGGRKLVNPKLRALAKRTCYAASVALGTSVVNILILTLLHGRQLGWVCLASCGFDVRTRAQTN
jgi:hypothetical protein